jgi:spore coat protein U-like protein
MRTKTLLLTAAALLAVGIVSSRADSPVYSQNVVGYASATLPGSQFTMMTVPFVIGVSNGADEVFGLAANPSALPPGSTILIYSTAATTIPMSNVAQVLGANGTLPVPAQSYVTYYYDPEYVGLGYGAWWSDGNDENNLPTPALPVGRGFFILPANSFTPTFAGTVAVNTGGTGSTIMPASQFTMVGSVIPYAGDITVGTAGSLTNNLPAGSTVLIYSTAATTIPLSNVAQVLGANGTLTVPAQSYVTYYYDPEYVSLGYGPWWSDGNDENNMPAPSLSVGQGMFVLPAGTFNWQQTLPSN